MLQFNFLHFRTFNPTAITLNSFNLPRFHIPSYWLQSSLDSAHRFLFKNQLSYFEFWMTMRKHFSHNACRLLAAAVITCKSQYLIRISTYFSHREQTGVAIAICRQDVMLLCDSVFVEGLELLLSLLQHPSVAGLPLVNYSNLYSISQKALHGWTFTCSS